MSQVMHFTICLPISSAVVENRPHQNKKKKFASSAADFFFKNKSGRIWSAHSFSLLNWSKSPRSIGACNLPFMFNTVTRKTTRELAV